MTHHFYCSSTKCQLPSWGLQIHWSNPLQAHMLLLCSYLRKSLPTWFHLLRVQNELLLEHGASKGQKQISCVQVPMGFFTPCRRQSLWLAQNLALFLLNLLSFVSLLSSSNWHLSQRRWPQHITLTWYHKLYSPISRFWDRVLWGGCLLRSTPRIDHLLHLSLVNAGVFIQLGCCYLEGYSLWFLSKTILSYEISQSCRVSPGFCHHFVLFSYRTLPVQVFFLEWQVLCFCLHFRLLCFP